MIQMIQRYCYSILKAFIIFFIDRIMSLFCYLSNQENLYMIHHYLDFFYDIYNTINGHNQRQTNDLLLIPNYFDIYF